MKSWNICPCCGLKLIDVKGGVYYCPHCGYDIHLEHGDSKDIRKNKFKSEKVQDTINLARGYIGIAFLTWWSCRCLG